MSDFLQTLYFIQSGSSLKHAGKLTGYSVQNLLYRQHGYAPCCWKKNAETQETHLLSNTKDE